MCGIVGYKGRFEAAPILLEGLKRLEYRGYDSAGLAVWHEGRIKVQRKKGKVDELREALCLEELKGSMGIAHTRWATHGLPSDENAHPHMAFGICVVHNGIIENYLDIKTGLRRAGHEFLSDTDSEVIPHLIARMMMEGRDLLQAVMSALRMLEGSYAVAIICEGQDLIVGARKDSPLVCSLKAGEFFIASDVPAILDKTRDFIFLEDGDVVLFDGKELRIFDLSGHRVDRRVQTVDWTASMAEKGGFKHFMLKEIFEEPRALTETMMGRVREERAEIELENLDIELPDRVFLVACGTSFHAGLIGKHIFESLLRVPVEVDLASEFRYRDPIIGQNDLLVLISQSGETADTIAALREGRVRGARTLSICNVLGSTLSRESEYVVYTHAGPEIGVASTKAFVSQVLTILMLALHLGRKEGMIGEDAMRAYIRELKRLPHLVKDVLDRATEIEEMSQRYAKYRHFLYLGRGINYPTALEGALKLKEISYIHAEGYAAGEMKHGPIALIDEEVPALFVSPSDKTYRKTISNIEEVHARKGTVVLLTDEEAHEMRGRARDVIVVPKTIYELQPITTVVPLQLFAYYIANSLGLDVDQPRNLAKSVTVE
jgi:glucosamine--fructose-6-phosphate aminotransferase (isomerizing)